MTDQPAIAHLRGCTGKEPFGSPQLARKVLDRWMASKRRRGKLERRAVEPYRCTHCGHWHLGGPV